MAAAPAQRFSAETLDLYRAGREMTFSEPAAHPTLLRLGGMALLRGSRSFIVIQRLSIGADLYFRPFSVSHDLCFVCHKLVFFSQGLNLDQFSVAGLGLKSVPYRGR
jgi:hypothetical protein